jgi:hypothetical protein
MSWASLSEWSSNDTESAPGGDLDEGDGGDDAAEGVGDLCARLGIGVEMSEESLLRSNELAMRARGRRKAP